MGMYLRIYFSSLSTFDSNLRQTRQHLFCFVPLRQGKERGTPADLISFEDFRTAAEMLIEVSEGFAANTAARFPNKPQRHYFTTIILTQRKKGYRLLRLMMRSSLCAKRGCEHQLIVLRVTTIMLPLPKISPHQSVRLTQHGLADS